MKYQPKRSRAKFSEGAPEYVLACYDNGGKTADRYTVLLGGSQWSPEMGRTVFCLTMSGAPTHPLGVSQSGEMNASNRPHSRQHIPWLALPENIRAHVMARVRENDAAPENVNAPDDVIAGVH